MKYFNSIWIKVIAVLVIGFSIGFLIPNKSNLLGNKSIKKLLQENDSLSKEITKRDIENKKLDTMIVFLSKKNNLIEMNIDKRNQYIKNLEDSIRKIDLEVKNIDTNIDKIKKDGYEEINDVPNWNNDKRVEFFTEFFRDTKTNNSKR